MLLRSDMFVGISMVTLQRMQIDIREFMVVEDLEDVICRVREFLNLILPTTCCFKFIFHKKGESSSNNLVKIKVKLITSWSSGRISNYCMM